MLLPPGGAARPLDLWVLPFWLADEKRHNGELCMEGFYAPGLEVVQLAPTFYWLKVIHMGTPNCKGGWEISSRLNTLCALEKEKIRQ